MVKNSFKLLVMGTGKKSIDLYYRRSSSGLLGGRGLFASHLINLFIYLFILRRVCIHSEPSFIFLAVRISVFVRVYFRQSL